MTQDHPPLLTTAFLFLSLTYVLYRYLIQPLFLSPLSAIPGPKEYALTGWRLALDEYLGRRTRTIHRLHSQYGPAIRIGPNEVHFNTPSAVKTIYGAGSGLERTDFYRMFDVYGRKNLFTFSSAKDHAVRKKLVAGSYSKTAILKDGSLGTTVVEEKVGDFLRLIDRQGKTEVFESLHWFSLDVISNFLYGDGSGGTKALKGDQVHRQLLTDILDPARRRLAWFAVHMPKLTKWLYSREGSMGKVVKPLLPMQKPATYSGIRAHALEAMTGHIRVRSGEKDEKGQQHMREDTIIAKVWKYHRSQGGSLSDLDIASECADHLLAGIDTTSDTLMFLLWALSLPQNAMYQDKLIQESRSIPHSDLGSSGDVVKPEAADKLPYLRAIVQETLRLYSALPASEPRSSPVDVEIDGYLVPAGTTVSCAPYSLHRNADVFPDPLRWNPERWFEKPSRALMSEMKQWYWPFSSGARMCVGMHLALAEMAIVPSIYRKFGTRLVDAQGRSENDNAKTPGFTSRFEVFCDEVREEMGGMEEHVCWVEFVKH